MGGLSSFSLATYSAVGAVVSQAEPNLLPHLLKSGSTDNIAALKDLEETQGDEGVGPGATRTLRTRQLQSSLKNSSDDDCSSSAASGFAGAPGGPLSSRDNTPDHAQASDFDAVLHEIQELWENQGQLEECFENLKYYHQQEYTVVVEALQEERYR